MYAQLHIYILLDNGKISHKIALSSQPKENQRKEPDLDKMIIWLVQKCHLFKQNEDKEYPTLIFVFTIEPRAKAEC